MSKPMRVAALLLVLATAGSVAACASSSKSKAGGGSTPAAARNGFTAYADCLRRNGVTLPSGRANRPTARPTARPSGGFRGGGGFGNRPPAGVDPQTWQKAQQACQAVRPTAGPGGGRNSGAFTAYRNCLADHGVTMSAGPGELSTADPKIAAALKACEVLRPTARPAPSATG